MLRLVQTRAFTRLNHALSTEEALQEACKDANAWIRANAHVINDVAFQPVAFTASIFEGHQCSLVGVLISFSMLPVSKLTELKENE